VGFHSDSVSGVQGTITGVSLGSPASLKFRPLEPRSVRQGGMNRSFFS